MEIDVDSVAAAGPGLLKAWVSHTFATTRQSLEHSQIRHKSDIQLYLFNCAEKTAAVVQEALYSDDLRQNLISSNSIPRAQVLFDDVIPESVGEGALEVACAIALNK